MPGAQNVDVPPSAPTTYLLTREDLSITPMTDGAWIGHVDGSFTMRAPGIFPVVKRVVQLLSGERTDEDVVTELADQDRAVIEVILQALLSRRCAVRLPEPLSETGLRHGNAAHSLIPSLARFTADPFQAFENLTASRVLLVSGQRGTLASQLDATAIHPAAFRRETWADVIANPPESPLNLRQADVVVLDADAADRATVRRMQAALLRSGLSHVTVGTVGGRHWIVRSTNTAPRCWHCLAARIDAITEGRHEALSSLSRAIAGQLLRKLVIESCADLGANSQSCHAVTVDGPENHDDTASDVCRCGLTVENRGGDAPRDTVDRDPDRGNPDPPPRRNLGGVSLSPKESAARDSEFARMIAALTRWTDPLLGPFRTINAETTSQVPLGHAVAEILAGSETSMATQAVEAFALSSREAIYQAALVSLEILANSTNDSGSRPVFVGWNRSEAQYRAAIQKACRDDVSRELTAVDLFGADALEGSDPTCRETALFLAHRDTKVSKRHIDWFSAIADNGMRLAVGRVGDREIMRGAGFCVAEAITMALMSCLNTRRYAGCAPVPPHTSDWSEVWQQITPPAGYFVSRPHMRFCAQEVKIFVPR